MNALAVNRGFCDKIEKKEETETPAESKMSGFAKAFEKFSAPQSESLQQDDKLPDLPFATLFRNSKLTDVSWKFPHEKLMLTTFSSCYSSEILRAKL